MWIPCICPQPTFPLTCWSYWVGGGFYILSINLCYVSHKYILPHYSFFLETVFTVSFFHIKFKICKVVKWINLSLHGCCTLFKMVFYTSSYLSSYLFLIFHIYSFSSLVHLEFILWMAYCSLLLVVFPPVSSNSEFLLKLWSTFLKSALVPEIIVSHFFPQDPAPYGRRRANIWGKL